jgi:hypothetical protein
MQLAVERGTRPGRKQFSVAEMRERAHLLPMPMPMPEPFDSNVEKHARGAVPVWCRRHATANRRHASWPGGGSAPDCDRVEWPL